MKTKDSKKLKKKKNVTSFKEDKKKKNKKTAHIKQDKMKKKKKDAKVTKQIKGKDGSYKDQGIINKSYKKFKGSLKGYKDISKISVTKGEKTLIIDNPTNYPLVGMGSQGAVFKLNDELCVKIYTDPLQAQMEMEALLAGRHLSFFPRVYKAGPNYIVMDYFNAPTLKEYLKNTTYMPKSIAIKLLDMLKEMEKAKFTMVDAPLRHIFVLENEELKVIDHVNAFKRIHPVPLKLLRDLNYMLLRESFLERVRELDPKRYKSWIKYIDNFKVDYKNMPVVSGRSGESVKLEFSYPPNLIGKGHQGAVFRLSEDRCVKVYPKPDNCKQESKVLLNNQHLSFIPKVYDTGKNYVEMEFLSGPDLNSFLKKQDHLPEEVTRALVNILKEQKQGGFIYIDAPLRHVFITNDGFKMVDHVFAYTRDQYRPLELFQNLYERGFLDDFLEQLKVIEPELHALWTKEPIPLVEPEPPISTQLRIVNPTQPVPNQKAAKDEKAKKEEKKKKQRKKSGRYRWS